MNTPERCAAEHEAALRRTLLDGAAQRELRVAREQLGVVDDEQFESDAAGGGDGRCLCGGLHDLLHDDAVVKACVGRIQLDVVVRVERCELDLPAGGRVQLVRLETQSRRAGPEDVLQETRDARLLSCAARAIKQQMRELRIRDLQIK